MLFISLRAERRDAEQLDFLSAAAVQRVCAFAVECHAARRIWSKLKDGGLFG